MHLRDRTPRRWENPLVLLTLVLLFAVALRLGSGVQDREPRGPCAPLGLTSLSLAGTVDEANAVLTCPKGAARDDFRDAAERALASDSLFIPVYAVTIGAACAYGALRTRRRLAARAAWGLFGLLFVGVVADLVENSALCSLIDGEMSAGLVDRAFGASATKWLTLTPVVMYAISVLAMVASRLVRQLGGDSVQPTFFGSLSYTPDPAPVRERENKVDRLLPTPERVAHRYRGPRGCVTAPQGVGICLSGGGIRSASFALGAVQELVSGGVYQKADYIATVSGGGYLGTAAQIIAVRQEVSPVRGDLAPFADGAPETQYLKDHSRYLWPSALASQPPQSAAPGHPPRPAVAGQRWSSTRDFVSAMGAAVGGIGLNVGLVLMVLFALARPIGWAVRAGFDDSRPEWRTGFVWATIAIVVAASGLIVPFVVDRLRAARWAGWRRPATVLMALAAFACAIQLVWWDVRSLQAAMTALGVLAVIAVVLALRDRLHLFQGVGIILGLGFALLFEKWLHDATRHGSSQLMTWRIVLVPLSIAAASVSAILVAAALRCVLPTAEKLERENRSSRPTLLLAFTIVGVVFVGFVLAGIDYVSVMPDWWTKRLQSPSEGGIALGNERSVWLVVVAVLAGAYAFLDQKRWSPHPLYKRRLSRTFAPARAEKPDGSLTATELPYGRPTTMSHWLRKPKQGPQLLICAAAYDTKSVPDPIKAWPWVFSADYVGSADIGWSRTVDFEAVLGRSNATDGTLAAAMAISGAAVSPALGQINLGSLNAAIALLNARLGVWLPAPFYINELRDLPGYRSREQAATGGPPVRWIRLRRYTYLFKEIFGLHDPDDRMIFVTDGGQYDNLGLTELLAQRCRLIYCFDASGDAKPGKWQTTATLDGVRALAWERYGIRFSRNGTLCDPQFDTVTQDEATKSWPKPTEVGFRTPTNAEWDASADNPAAALLRRTCKERVAASPVEVFDIIYPMLPGDSTQLRGKLVYAKAVLSLKAQLDAAVHSTRVRAKRFPSDSTADQWLDPGQRDAYISLGRSAAAAAIKAGEPFA